MKVVYPVMLIAIWLSAVDAVCRKICLNVDYLMELWQ